MKVSTNPSVSIIVPVYNPGIYFEKCILSLINQTLENIEIIFIMDCPTDESENIAQKYVKIDNRLKIIRNDKNIHAGLSRNKGIEVAVGEFIGFHDADDYSEPTMYEELYNKAINENLDAARCNFHCIYPPNSKHKNEFYIYPKVTEDLSKKKEIYEKICNNTVSCVVWSHIFKREFLKKHKLFFVDSSIVTSEDSLFILEAYQYLDKIGIISQGLYYHIFHETNTGKSYKHRSINNRITFFEFLDSFLKDRNISKDERLLYLSVNIARSMYSASRQVIIEKPIKQALKEIKQIYNNPLTLESFNYLSQKNKKSILSQQKITIRLFVVLMRIMAIKNL